MKSLFGWRLLLSGWLMAVFALSSGAQTAAPPPSPATALKTAEQLYNFGTEHEDPVALVAAARLLLAAGFSAKDGNLGNLAPGQLLGQAADMAGSGSVVEIIVADTRAVPKGVVEGAPIIVGQLAPGQSKSYRMMYAGGETADATVRLSEKSNADLDVRILDDKGQVVASDELARSGIYSNGAYTSWVPHQCGEFEIEITNHGTDRASFQLSSSLSRVGCKTDDRTE